MSTVYGSTEKLYPSLPSAPQHDDDESHIYRLKKIEEIDSFPTERDIQSVKDYTRNLNDIPHQLE